MSNSLIIRNIDDLNKALSSHYVLEDKWHFQSSYSCSAAEFVSTIQTAIIENTLRAPLPTLIFRDMSMPRNRFPMADASHIKKIVCDANLSKEHEMILTNLGLTFQVEHTIGTKRTARAASQDDSTTEEIKSQRTQSYSSSL